MIHLQTIADLLAATKDNKLYITTVVRSSDNFLQIVLSVIDNDNNPNILAISFGNNRAALANLADRVIRQNLSEKGYKVISGRVGSGIEINVSFGRIFNDNGDLLVDIPQYRGTKVFFNADAYTGGGIETKEINISPENREKIENDLKELAEKEATKEVAPEKRKRNTKENK